MRITYRTCEDSKTLVVKEGASITIPDGSEILGAAYGSTDVTKELRAMYAAGEREIVGKSGTFTDPWKGPKKSFSVTFRQCQDKTVIVKEHASITLP